MTDHLLPAPRSDPDALDSLAQALAPPLKRSFQLFVTHNPFYLLSALAMFAGCYLLNNSMHMHAGNLAKLIVLLCVLNVYEFLLIGLAGRLMKNPATKRDAKILVVMESLFLLDFAFLNAETILADHFIGSLINLVVFGLAVIKLKLLLRLLALQLGVARQIFLMLQMFLLYAMPWSFVPFDFNSVPELHIYLLWWCIGLLPILFEMLLRLAPGAMRQESTEPGSLAIARFYLLLPFLSLLLHVHFDHWIWQSSLHLVFYAPLLLGLSITLTHVRPAPWLPAGEILLLRVILPFVAVLMAVDTPRSLQFTTGTITITPMATVLLGAYFTYAIAFFWSYLPILGTAAALLLTIRILGPSPTTVSRGFTDGWTSVTTFLRDLGAPVWGMFSIGASFVLLALGAAASLRRVDEPAKPQP